VSLEESRGVEIYFLGEDFFSNSFLLNIFFESSGGNFLGRFKGEEGMAFFPLTL